MSALLRSSLTTLSIASRYALTNPAVRHLPAAHLLARCLFTEGHLRIDRFRDTHAKISSDFGSIRDQFIERIKQSLENPSKVIFTEDVKNVLYLAKGDDLNILKPLLSKYAKQKESEESFSKYSFGPLIARLLYVNRRVDLILELWNDPEIEPLLGAMSSYSTVCDLLLREGKFEETVALLEKFTALQPEESKYPLDIAMLYSAACYKVGTEESLAKLKAYTTGFVASRGHIPARVFAFYALLALKNGKTASAYELSSQVRTRSAVAFNTRLRIQTELGLYDEALVNIQSFIDQPSRTTPSRPFFLQSVYDGLAEAINANGSEESKEKLKNLNNRLVALNCFDPKSLDELAFIEADYNQRREARKEGGPYQGRYSDQPNPARNYDSSSPRRPGFARSLGGPDSAFTDRRFGERRFDDRRFDDRRFGERRFDDRRFDDRRSDDRFDRSERPSFRRRDAGGNADFD